MKTIYYNSTSSHLGTVWAAVSDAGLWALDYGMDEGEFLDYASKRGKVNFIKDEERPAMALKQAQEYLKGERKEFDYPVDWEGMTDFQIAARKAVMAIPAGETSSYGEIAKQIGKPRAARAVGLANATNPIIFVIPCHRVIGADGSLTGYGGQGGIKTKQWLLEMEKAQ